MGVSQKEVFDVSTSARWDPASYTWSSNPYKWPYKWVTGVVTLLIRVITPFISGRVPPRIIKVAKIFSENY